MRLLCSVLHIGAGELGNAKPSRASLQKGRVGGSALKTTLRLLRVEDVRRHGTSSHPLWENLIEIIVAVVSVAGARWGGGVGWGERRWSLRSPSPALFSYG
ncbi:hypothetical protein PAAG_08764 [Paracoccidioides lutzii Pb01]|uniref:Uncharacterized protein n=1 Tax=Paracoccidioides lutzii (strain ATCC MYA-826 / Pb01) TaxID=502779 RepID=C1HDC3_PARBA|nr:hypothetical protein PAAG_08764 [Paracoccidioides lutzii Pb01]EEH39495.2 hypothetical protein PAAG_08764 [Paracoccidioides lutzii Pb01]